MLAAIFQNLTTSKRTAAAVALLGVVIVFYILVFKANKTTIDKKNIDKWFTVKKNDFTISLTVDGTLDAIKRHEISLDLPKAYELKIETIATDKTSVKKGDIIATFATGQYLEEKDRLTTSIEDEKKNLILAQQEFEIQKSSNLTNLKNAFDRLKSAQDAIHKYKELEAPKKRKDLQAEIKSTQDKYIEVKKKYSQAEDKLREAERKEKTVQERAAAKLLNAEAALTVAKKAISEANYKSRVFKQYDYPQKIRSLKRKLIEAKLNLQQVTVKSQANIVQSSSRITNYRLRLKQNLRQLKDIIVSLEKLQVKAPVSGIITHGNPYLIMRGRNSKELKAGTTIRNREVFASIPDLSQFIINTNIAEEFRSQIKEKLLVDFSSTAIPKLQMQGFVKEIAPMASHIIFWDKNSPKVYQTKIATSANDKRLMPGMTVRIEITIEKVKNVLFVPIEALYNREGNVYCQVKSLTGISVRQVSTGRSSNHFVEIIKGLNQGDEVLLNRSVSPTNGTE